MRWVAVAGFAAGTAIVLAVFLRELSDNAEKMKASVRLAEQREREQQEADWRLFLRRWEAAA